MKSKLSIIGYVNKNSFLILHNAHGKVKTFKVVTDVRPSFIRNFENGETSPAYMVFMKEFSRQWRDGTQHGYGIVVAKERVLVRRMI